MFTNKTPRCKGAGLIQFCCQATSFFRTFSINKIKKNEIGTTVKLSNEQIWKHCQRDQKDNKSMEKLDCGGILTISMVKQIGYVWLFSKAFLASILEQIEE